MLLRYIKFLVISILRKWSFYVTTIVYLFLLCLIAYILPVIMKKDLIIVSKYVFIYMFILLFAVISVSIISIQLFRLGIDDGSEIIIVAKPITRGQIVWGKIFTFIIFTLVISAIAALLMCFSMWTHYGGRVIGLSITLGGFLGTLVVYCVFGSIAVLLSLVLKKIGTLLVNIGIFCIFLIYGMVSNFTVTIPATNFLETYSVNPLPVSLVTKTKTDKLGYQWGAVSGISNGELQIQLNKNKALSPSNFLSYYWNKSTTNTFRSVMYTNLIYQLVNLYTLNWEPQFNVPFIVYNEITRYQVSPYTILKFKNVDLFRRDDINKVNPYSEFNKKLIYFNYLATNNLSNLKTYYLTNTVRFGAMSLLNKHLYISDYGTNLSQGIIKDINSKKIKLPVFNTKGLVEQTFSVDNSNQGFVKKNPYQEFLNYYFSNSNINIIDKLLALLANLNKSEKINPLSFYITLFAISDIKNYFESQTPDQLRKNHNLIKLLNLVAIQTTNFQYWTLLALLNSPYNNKANAYVGYNNKQLQTMLDCLVPEDVNGSKNVVAFVASPTYALTTFMMLRSKDFSQVAIAKQNILKNLYGISPFFNLTNSKALTTYTIASGANFYSMTGLVLGWICFSLFILVLAVGLYSRRDFS